MQQNKWQQHPPRHVVIVGAGVIGAASAVEALAAGWRVTLVEPGEPGGEQAASYGNAGWLSTHSIIPPAEPGVWKNLPGYLADPLGPLAIRWRYLPRATPWLLRYLASGWTPSRVAATASALRPLLLDAPRLHQDLARRAGVPQYIAQRGLLHVFTSRGAFESDTLGWRLRRANGVAWEELDAAALRSLEPALHSRYTFGVRIAEAGHCTNPGLYVAALVKHACANGARLLRGQAEGFRIEKGRLRAIHINGAAIDCDRAVIAAGIHSKALAARVGDTVPLETERGYHAEIDTPEVVPNHSLMAADRKVVVTPMTSGLRVAGQVEIAGVDAAPDWRRAGILREHLLSILPGLPRQLPETRVRQWLGHRPSMADGRPCIGLASDCQDVIHAFGHGHVGLVSAARTGKLVAQLLDGREPEIDLRPFSPQRFA